MRGLSVKNCINWTVTNNTFDNTNYGVLFSSVNGGNVNSPEGFSGNQFNGTQNIGLLLGGPSVSIGDQTCRPNKWNGTFSENGAINEGTDPTTSEFRVFGGTSPNLPPNPSPASGWFIPNSLCSPYLIEPDSENQESAIFNEKKVFSEGIAIFPNPVYKDLHIRFPESQSSGNSVSISDMAGKLVLRHESNEEIHSSEVILNIVHLPPGLYLVKTAINGQLHVEKIVKTE